MLTGRSAQPKSLGPYEIRASLGQGGGGEVYRAWDPRLEREVALKILHERFEIDPERVRRFVAEARAASALNHPNIVTVFDAAVDGTTPYIVSELVDGKPLREEILRGPMPVKRLLDVGTQIADGLSAAHEAGIVHRDLKPENIMLTRAGRAKIVDFGLARAGGFQTVAGDPPADITQTQTEVGLIAGTIPYMSPEQARGLTTDFRSDQFSFGLILYEMATGRRAFTRDTSAATLDAIINDDLPSLPALDSRAPMMLRWIIERCLAKEPGERYAATADLHRDLRTLRDKLSEAVASDANAPQASGRRWTRALVAGGVLALVAVGAMLAYQYWQPAAPDMSALRFTPFVTDVAYEGFPAFSPDGLTIAYAADVNGTLQIFTRSLGSSTSAQVTHHVYDCKHPFWSPDGQRIYYVSLAKSDEGIWSVGASGGTPQLIVANATRGALSPDGHTLAFLRDESRAEIVGTAALWLSTPQGAAPWPAGAVEMAAKHHGTLGGLKFIEGALAFSPDGTKLGVCVVSGPRADSLWQFWIVPMPEGTEYRRLQSWTEAAPRITNFTWLPDSRHVVLGANSLSTPGSHLWLADLDRDRTWPLTPGPDSQSYPSSSPTGDQIVFVKDDPDYYDLKEISLDRLEVRSLPSTTLNESDPEVSPNGQLLVYVTDRRGQDEIWLRSRDGRTPDRPRVTQTDFGTDRTLMLSSPAFSPDGDRIAYLRNGYTPRWPLRIWISMTAGGPPTQLLAPTYEAFQTALTWSPDGQWLAYTEWQEPKWALVKIRVGSGEPPVVLRSDGVANATPRWSPGRGEWITWETDQGFRLVSPDGKPEKVLADDPLSEEQWLAHTWSRDDAQIFGIKETGDRHLSLVALTVATGKTRALMDLGAAPPINNPVRGFSLSPDGKTITTSIVRLRGDLWLASGLAVNSTKFPYRAP